MPSGDGSSMAPKTRGVTSRLIRPLVCDFASPDMSVACVGSFSLVSMWRESGQTFLPGVAKGVFCNAVYGNDAVIVASVLNRVLRRPIALNLVAPTEADLSFVR